MTQQETESLILAAARTEFIAHGLRGARMQQIADRAGLNKALLHYYFRSKEKLYEAALSSMMLEVVASLRSAMQGAEGAATQNGAQILEMMVRAYTRVLRDNPDFPRMLARELADGGQGFAAVAQVVAPAIAQIRERMGAVAREFDSAQGVPLEHMMISMMSMVAGTFVFQPLYMQILPATGTELVLDDAFYEERVRNILFLLRGGSRYA